MSDTLRTLRLQGGSVGLRFDCCVDIAKVMISVLGYYICCGLIRTKVGASLQDDLRRKERSG